MAYKYLNVSDAAYAGDLPEVIHMINSGEPIDEQSLIESAVDGGHLHILQYLREKGIPFRWSPTHHYVLKFIRLSIYNACYGFCSNQRLSRHGYLIS